MKTFLTSMALNIHSTVKLNNGIKMPLYGLGTYLNKSANETTNTIKYALNKANIQLIDTAQFYENEKEIGDGIIASQVNRKDIFIVSKLFDTKDGREGAVSVIEDSLKLLGFQYIDLYLLHSPQGGKVLECYDVLVEYQKKGIIKSIGVSNFGVEHLDALKNSGRPMPQVNQIQLHPWWRLQRIVDWCKENNVAVMGYSPLARCHTFGHPLLVQLAKNYNKSPAQILIRWSLQKGFVTIPKSNRSERIDENVDVFDFEICDEDMDKFEQLFETGEQINVCKSDPTNNDMVTKFGPLI